MQGGKFVEIMTQENALNRLIEEEMCRRRVPAANSILRKRKVVCKNLATLTLDEELTIEASRRGLPISESCTQYKQAVDSAVFRVLTERSHNKMILLRVFVIELRKTDKTGEAALRKMLSHADYAPYEYCEEVERDGCDCDIVCFCKRRVYLGLPETLVEKYVELMHYGGKLWK
jgi:hypothetical protein